LPVDTLGLVLHALVTAADVQDRDGGVLLLCTLLGQFPFLRKLFADSAYHYLGSYVELVYQISDLQGRNVTA
jgi:hypothetical protein